MFKFEKNIQKKNNKRTVFIFSFLLLVLFHKWQVSTSNNYLDLGTKNYENKNYNEALKNYKYAAIIDGERSIIYTARIQRAKIFFKHGKLNKAEIEVYKAIKEKKNDYLGYELLGDIQYKKGNIEDSINFYQKAISLNKNSNIKIKLAKSFIAKDDIDKAKNIFTKLFLEDNDIEILYYLGLIDLYKERKYNNSFENVTKNGDDFYKDKIMKIENHLEYYTNGPNEDYNNILIADLYLKINQPYFAISKAKTVVKDNLQYRDAWIVLGKGYYLVGDYEKSFDCFDNALKLDSHNSEIFFWKNVVYNRMRENI